MSARRPKHAKPDNSPCPHDLYADDEPFHRANPRPRNRCVQCWEEAFDALAARWHASLVEVREPQA